MPRGRPSRDTIFDRFAAALDELRQFGGLPTPAEASKIWDDIWHLEAHNSTAIEGNTLVLREVERLLDTGQAIGAKPLKDYLEVKGYGDAGRWVYAQASGAGHLDADALVTVTEVREIHRLAMAPVWEVAPHPGADPAEAPGGFREHDIHPFSGGMRPTPWTDIGAQLTTWTDAANILGRQVGSAKLPARDLPVELARIHNAFEKIHPFIDGNGRTGRLVLNLILVRLGFPPAIIFKRDRDRYLSALDQADKGDPGRLAEQLARSVIDNLHRFVVPNIAGPARIVPLRSLEDSDLSYEALRQAARRGRLEAHQGSDGVWRSNRHAVELYKAARHRRS
ncbi:MAG: Fic family protein [Jatrophihabitantaceae bacterium]